MVTTRTLTTLWLAGLLGACDSEEGLQRVGPELSAAGTASEQPSASAAGGATSGAAPDGVGCGKGCGLTGGSNASSGASDTNGGSNASGGAGDTNWVGGGAPQAGASSSAGVGGGASLRASYPGTGFIVHEWGTDTVVVGSDGSQQRGLHHEEEDLPAFVYDRQTGLMTGGSTGALSVEAKMETPVTYFYSDIARSVSATVRFPLGVLTQWFPDVTSFAPLIAQMAGTQPGDPVLDATFPFVKESCREKYSAVANGRLTWGPILVLARGAPPTTPPAAAPLDRFSWNYAREVAANQLQMGNGESERFLFYRGLGNFELPLAVSAKAGGQLTLANRLNEALGSLFVIHVDEERGAFSTHSAGLLPHAQISTQVPTLEGATPIDGYAEELGQAVTDTLDSTGLYHDEAVAMVNTWKRQWFRTPGTRLLYVVPQSWTEASIPLSIEPGPDQTVRVMLIRVEVITPEQEQSDVEAVLKFGSNLDLARSHFTALGRFAEPRLRRALTLSPSALGSAYLAEFQGANSSSTSGE